MTITTKRAEELAAYLSSCTLCQKDKETAEALRALAKERDELKRNAEGFAQLYIERGEQLAAVEKERDELTEKQRLSTEMLQRACISSIEKDKQLAAAQAVIAKKDEALKNLSALVWRKDWRNAANRAELCSLLRTALALPSDDTALREMLAEQWEKAAKVCQDDESGRDCNGYFADVLRAEAYKLRKQSAQGEAA